MKTIEPQDPFGNAIALPVEAIKPLFAVALCYKINGRWNVGRIFLGREESKSLFYNSMLYIRVMFPFWLGIQIRWAGKNPTRKEYLQTGLGWKLNGRLAILLRIQSDRASAVGVTGPNVGQAEGWEYGTK